MTPPLGKEIASSVYGSAASPGAARTSGVSLRLSVRTTASPIRRMRTSGGMASGSLADVDYWRCAGTAGRLFTTYLWAVRYRWSAVDLSEHYDGQLLFH